MFSSRLTAFFRRKGVSITDSRVQKMNEILNYIKFIKMYAWVKAFSQAVRRKYSPLDCVQKFPADPILPHLTWSTSSI